MPNRRQWKNAQPDSPRKTIGRSDEAKDGVDLTPLLELRRVLRGRRSIHLREGGGECPVEVRRAEMREHVVVEDRLALLVRQEGGLEPGPRVELDLAVLEVRFQVEEDDKAVVEALASDAPLIDQGARLHFRFVGRRVFAAVLGVDDDLRAGPRLDLIDDPLGVDDGGR